MIIKKTFILTLLMIVSIEVYSCSCGHVSISREADKAYDFVIGKITDEREDSVTCFYEHEGKLHENYTTYSYSLDVEFSYKGKLCDVENILGSKYGGNCGGYFEKDKTYLITIYKCDRGYYTFMCSNNALLSESRYEITYLNKYFHKNYQLLKLEFLIPVVLLSLLVISTSAIIVFRYFKYRTRRRLDMP
ncbi:MAG TPA: hypothetical protein VL443_08500 [Cyclobacteriaceae bacterium]|jgi:hypothetical protein|nr:hypothetical protein [Cyclobacteriaceae bacterium]